MMRSVGVGVLVGLLGFAAARTASAQSAAPPAAAASAPSSTAAPAAAPPPPVTAAPAPAAAPAPPAAAPAGQPAPVPQGYMLVPIPSGTEPQTRYDVQYPQARGALPPGMELPYEDGDPIPPGYRLVTRKRRGLIIAGSIVTGVPWAFGVMGAVGNDFQDNTGLLLIPVIGPWALLATNTARDGSCGPTDSFCDASKASLRSALVLDGIVQLAGASMFVAGMFFPRTRLVRRDVVVSVVPTTLGHGGYGIGALGTF